MDFNKNTKKREIITWRVISHMIMPSPITHPFIHFYLAVNDFASFSHGCNSNFWCRWKWCADIDTNHVLYWYNWCSIMMMPLTRTQLMTRFISEKSLSVTSINSCARESAKPFLWRLSVTRGPLITKKKNQTTTLKDQS